MGVLLGFLLVFVTNLVYAGTICDLPEFAENEFSVAVTLDEVQYDSARIEEVRQYVQSHFQLVELGPEFKNVILSAPEDKSIRAQQLMIDDLAAKFSEVLIFNDANCSQLTIPSVVGSNIGGHEKPEEAEKVEQVEKAEAAEKVEQVDSTEKPEFIEKVEQVETEGPEQVERVEQVEEVEQPSVIGSN